MGAEQQQRRANAFATAPAKVFGDLCDGADARGGIAAKLLLDGSAENRASVIAGSVGIQTIKNSTLSTGGHTVVVSDVVAASGRYGSSSAAAAAGLNGTSPVTITGLNAGTHQVVITGASAASIKSSQALGTQTILSGGTMTITNGSTALAVSFGSSTANTAQNIVNEINADAGSSFTASVQQDGSVKIVTNALGGSQGITIAVDGTSLTQAMLGMSTLVGSGGTTATAALDGGTAVQLNNTADTFTLSDGKGGQMTLTDTVTSQAGWQSATLDMVINPATFLARLDNGDTVSMTQGTTSRLTSGLSTGGNVDLLFNSTVTAGSATLNVVDNALQFQIGGFSGQTSKISFGNIGPDKLGIGLNTLSNFSSLAAVDVTSAQGASDSVKLIDQAISEISKTRAELGSFQSNILESNQNYMRIALENLSAAQSVVEDTDFASELAMFTRNQILMQSGTAMLAQANLLPQSVLKLLG